MARLVDATRAIDVSQAVSHFLPCPLQIPHEGDSQVGTAGHVKAPSSAATPAAGKAQMMLSVWPVSMGMRQLVWQLAAPMPSSCSSC
jgi:hypothetical protein